MTDLLERLRRDDPSALEEAGHALLPFVQAAVLAQSFESREPEALLQLFRAEVALATRSTDAAGFPAAVVGQLRARAASLPLNPPDPSLIDALARLALLAPLPVPEREVVIARFVERLPAALICAQLGLDAAALAAILSRGATLLVGPAVGAADWTGEPSLLDPDAPPVAQLVGLENVLTCLAIDVTALERQPLISAVPVLKPGFEPQVPQESYPSRVATQASVDLPANVSSFGPVPEALPSRPSRPSRPSVVVEPDVETTSSAPTPLPGVSPRRAFEEGTEPQAAPLSPGGWPQSPEEHEKTEVQTGPLTPPAEAEKTESGARPLPFAAAEKTESGARPLPFAAAEKTESGARPLPASMRPPTPFAAEEKTASTFNPAPGQSAHARAWSALMADLPPEADDQTVVRLPVTLAPLPFHRKVPARWWWAGAGLCAVLGVSLYMGMVSYVRGRVQRQWTMVPVIAAARDLPEGTRITLEQLAIRAIPGQNVTASVVKPEALEYALGRTLEFPLQAGDPLLWSQFDGAQKYKRFHVIKRGRAYTIAVTELRSLGGHLMPNEEVDLVMAFNQTSSDPKVKSKFRALTLLQKVKVLAVGAVTTLNIGRVQRRFTDLTLMLMPEEVEVLSLAARTGEITATLRHSEDDDVIGRGETTMHTLLSGVRLKALERRRGAVIATIRERPAQ